MSRSWRGVVSVNVLVLAMLCLGLLNNVLIATVFGLTRRVDAWFAALMLPAIFPSMATLYFTASIIGIAFMSLQLATQTLTGAIASPSERG